MFGKEVLIVDQERVLRALSPPWSYVQGRPGLLLSQLPTCSTITRASSIARKVWSHSFPGAATGKASCKGNPFADKASETV